MATQDVVLGFAPSFLNGPSTPPVTPPPVSPSVYIAPGTINIYTHVPGLTVIVPYPDVTYIWVNQTGQILMNLTGFPTINAFPIAIVTTSLYGVVGCVDSRPLGFFSFAGSSPTGQTSSNETPSGAVNSSNTTFTLAFSPNPTTSLQLYRNGQLQTQGLSHDYVVVGNVITYNYPPVTGDILLAFYSF